MGVVFEVFDHKRQEAVALKSLGHVDARGIYSLKKEFRSLASVRHDNIVKLYELGSESEQWFFTMELVSGLPFSRYVRPPVERRTGAQDAAFQGVGLSSSGETLPAGDLELEPPRFHESRLRAALKQLVRGVMAIHAAGKLHRDLKPSNVLVTSEGRVVILDFGLVQDAPAVEDRDGASERNVVVGTPAFMAPEQAAAMRAEEASDWYAVGVMLYMSLTGRLPFEGRVSDVLSRKQNAEPSAPSHLVAGIPRDLDDLCHRLLARSPSARPKAQEIARIVGLDPVALPSSPASTPPDAFVGRGEHLEALMQALDGTRAGVSRVVTMTGPPGNGKSALAEAFLRKARVERDALTLSARCTEQEAMPFQALDSIVDALSVYLNTLPREQVPALLPRATKDLVRLFPVLGRVDAVELAPAAVSGAPDLGHQRSQAFAAFGEVLGRIGDRGFVVLHVDCPHWADADSADLLHHVLTQSISPAVLVLLTYTQLEFNGSVFGERWKKLQLAEPVAAETVHVGPLPLDESIVLALRVLGTGLSADGINDHQANYKVAQRLATMTGGNPYLIKQLAARAAKLGPASLRTFELEGSGDGALLRVIREDMAELPPEARRLLFVAALSPPRVQFQVLVEAADIPTVEHLSALQVLREKGWVTLAQLDGRDALELQSQEVRVAARDGASDIEKRTAHLAIARRLESSHADPRQIAAQFLAGGEATNAVRHWLNAAEAATQGLAFVSAAALYQQVLQHGSALSPERTLWLERLADCQAHAGDPLGASRSLLEAAELAEPDRALRLMERAVLLQADSVTLRELATEGVPNADNLFEGIGAESLSYLLGGGQVRTYTLNATVAAPEQEAPGFAVVLTGQVTVWSPHAAEGAAPIGVFGAGSVVGAVPFLLGQPPMTLLRAGEEGTRVLSLSREHLQEMGRRHPELALQLLLNVSRIVCMKLANVRTKALGSKTA